MSAKIHIFHKKTNADCPICSAPMHMVYWRDGSNSLMCLKCYFGFNYNNEKSSKP